MPIVSVEDLTRVYGEGETKVSALAGVSLTIEPGEFVAVMGPSGCGKSTLLNLIGGLDRPTSGTVTIGDAEISTLSDHDLTELRRRRIGFVFQFFNLVPVLTATENAALPLTLDGVPTADAEDKARQWLGRVGLAARVRSLPSQLSGGQQQRVAVARALVTEPALILADEPTGNLDSRSADDVAGLLKEAAGEYGRAVLMVTHDPRIAAFADRLIVMRDGAIVDDRPMEGGGEAAARLLVEAGA